MECSLSKDAISALRQKIYKDITTQVSEDKNVNVKSYIQSIYDLVYNKNESHAQALDAAKVVPAIMNQLQGLNAPFRKGLGTKKVMDVLNALDTFESNDLKGVEEYLDRTAKDNKSLEVMKAAAEEPVAEEIQTNGQMTLDFETLEEAEKAQEKVEEETTTEDEASTQQDTEEVEEEQVEEQEEVAQEGKKEIIDVVEEEATGAPSVEVQDKLNEKPQEPAPTPEKEKPKPEPDPSRNNYLKGVAKTLRDKITKFWNAVVPTFMSSSGIEADWWYSFKSTFRVPRSESKFTYGAQRQIISLLEDANVDNDGSLLNLNLSHGQPGVFLRAIRLDEIQGEYPTEAKQQLLSQNPNQVMLTYVDYNGNTILFDDNFNPSLQVGKAAYSPMRSANDSAMQRDKDYIQKEQIDQYYKTVFKPGVEVIFKTQGSKAGSREKAIKMKAAKDHVENEWAQSAKIENYLKENPKGNLKLNLTGGSMGFIATSQYVFSKLKDVKGAVTIKQALTNDPSLGLISGVTYITSPELYGQYIRLEQPGLAESEDLPFVKNLLFEDVENVLGEPLSFEVRSSQLQNYINVSGRGKGTTKVLMKEKGNSYTLQMENLENPQGAKVIYDMSLEADKEAAKKHFDQLLNKLHRVTPTRGGVKQTTGSVRQDEINLLRSEDVQAYAENKPLNKNKVKANTYVSNKYIEVNGKVDQYTKFIHDLRTNSNVSGENVETGKITALSDGKLVFEKENVPIKDFLGRQSFNIGTPDLASDGQLRRTNSYVTFQLSDEASDQLESPSIEEAEKLKRRKKLMKKYLNKVMS